MLEIIGFMFLVIVAVYISMIALLIMGNNLVKYNIGGVTNTWRDKIFAIVAIMVTLAVWYFVLQQSPFEINLKA